MINSILKNFELIASGQTLKTQGRGIKADNRRLYGIEKLRELTFELAAKGLLIEKGTIEDRVSKLSEVTDLIMGQAPPGNECNKDGFGTVFVKTGEFGELKPEIKEWTTKPLKFAKAGDVLICVVGATVGKLNLAIDCAIGRSVAAIRPDKRRLDVKYLYYALMPFTLKLREQSRGSAQGVIGKAELNAIEIRLPSLEEQYQVVAKIDELMVLCDQLENEQNKNNAAHETLVETLLDSLTSASGPGELESAWQRISDHFELLFTTEYSIDRLKQIILQLAIMGKLVEQDPNDEPASELLKRIKKEKERLVKEGKIKNQNHLDEIGEEEMPFELPKGWEFVRLGNIASKIGSGSTPKGSNYESSGVIFLRSQNVWNEGLEINDVTYISEHMHQKMFNTVVYPNDILLNITGASLGRSAIFPEDLKEANVSQHVTIIRPIDHETRFYLHLCILSPYFQKLVWERQVGMAREGLSKKVLEQFEIPFPPLAEQKRIVDKVYKLFGICDRLKERIRDAQGIERDLVEAIANGR